MTPIWEPGGRPGRGGGGSGLTLTEIGTITPDFGTDGQYAGDTSPGTGIARPSRVRSDEIWALHFGNEATQGEELRFLFGDSIPDSSVAAGDTANASNGAEIEVEGGSVFLSFGQGDTLFVARSAGVVTGEITLYRAAPGNDDFARALSASLGSNNVLTLGITRDGGSNLSTSVNLSRLAANDFVNAVVVGLTGTTLMVELTRAGGGTVDATVDLAALQDGNDNDFVSAAGLNLTSANVLQVTLTRAGGGTVTASVDLSSLAGTGGAGATNLAVGARDADSLEVQSSTGTNAELPVASETQAGLESAADKTQLGDLPPTWAAGTHAVGDQVAWDGKAYRCLVARDATNTDDPATDTTGWAELGTGGTTEAIPEATPQEVTDRSGTGYVSARRLPPSAGGSDGVATSVSISLSGTTLTASVGRSEGAALTDTVDLASLEEWRGAWSGLAGQTLRVGDLVEHTDRYYLVRVEHTRGNSGPDTNSAQFALLNSWGGTYDSDTFYHAGSFVAHSGGIYVNTSDVLDTDPDPDSVTNTKWRNLTAFTAADRTKLDAQPAAWAAGTFSAGDMRSYLGLIYERIADGTDVSADNPVTNTTDWRRVGAHGSLPVASESQAGIIEIADNTQTDDATNNTHAMTPVKTRRVTGALVTTGERTATTPASTVRRFTPADIVAMVAEYGGGLTVAEVNARITALVEAWALDATTVLPDAKLPASVVTETELNTAIANFRTAVQVQAAITAALAGLDLDEYLDYEGAWSDRAFAANAVVQHNGATYLCTQAAGSGTMATTEPGAGSQWRNFWDRLGYEDGPPNAFTGASRLDRTITFQREGGGTQELTLPAGGESAYSYYQEFTDQSTPAFSFAAIIANELVGDDADAAYTQTLLDTTVPAGLDLAKPIIIDYHGYMLFSLTGRREAEVSFGYRLFAGEANQITFWRNWRAEASPNIEYPITLDTFSSTGTLLPGTYPTDSGGTVEFNQALFNAPIHLQLVARFRGWNRNNPDPDGPNDNTNVRPPPSTVRQQSTISHWSMDQGGVTIYQFGAFEQSGTGSSRGDKLFTSNELPTTRGSTGAAIAGLTWTRNEAPDTWETDVPPNVDIIIPPDLPHDAAVIGVWAVGEDITDPANPVETGSAFVPWGGSDFSADTIRLADREYVGLASTVAGVTGKTTYRIRWNRPTGGGDDVQPNRRIVLYEAVAGQEGAPGKDGTTEFDPEDLGTHTFALDGSASEVALTDASNTAIICPDNGWIIATINVPTLGLVGQIVWILAEDLRAADADNSITAGLYTTAANQIVFHAGVQQMASTGNEILIEHLGDTRDSTAGAESAILPSIVRFDVEGTQFPAPGSLSGQSFTYDVAIGQPGHAASARIVGFAGARGAAPPASVAVLRNLTTLANETGTITLPAVTLADGEHYTIELQVYPTGRAPGDGEGVSIYSDYQITARAVTSQVHFGLFQYSPGDTIQDVIAGIDFAEDDISQANAAAGTYTFSGFSSDNEYVPYWAVPSSLTQPTSFTQNGFPVGAIIIANAITRTIAGVEYTIYHYELDDRIDSFADGVVTTVA